MTGLMDHDSDPYEKEDYKHIQEKPKVDNMDKIQR